MGQRIALTLIGIFLISLIPASDIQFTDTEDTIERLEPIAKRVEIPSDPDSIQDLGSPKVSRGYERIRENFADSSIGIFTEHGLIPSVQLSKSLSQPREDLAMVIVDGNEGIWDARLAIESTESLEIRTTIPPSGFLVQGSAIDLQNLKQDPVVVSVHPVPSGILVHPLLTVVEEGSIMVEILGWKNDELHRQMEPGIGLEGSLDEVAEIWLNDPWSPEEGRYWGEIDLTNLGMMMQHVAVAYVAPLPVLELKNNNARNHMGIDSVESFFITDIDGTGQIIAVGDSGIDHDHGDFNNRITERTSVTPGDSSTADLSDGHGTHVACTVLGSGMRSSGSYEGVAPGAELYFQAMEDDDTGALYSYGINSMLNSAYNSGARLHTNSWGAGSGFGSYSTQSEDADDRTSTWDQYWNHEGMTVLFAAGNERFDGVSPPGTAKNVITVGGHKNRYSGSPDEMYYWSSRGPTDDGRLKPDVVGPGDGVRSCLSQEAQSVDQNAWSNNYYIEYSGTSMATPAVAGAATLVRQYLIDVANRPAPQGALVKALLILGAEDMGARDIPNDDEGWGRVNLVNSLIPDSDEGIFVDDRSRISSGQTNEYTFEITRGAEPLKVVLAWSDYPGSSQSTNQLRNDLNLEVIHPNGAAFKGNVFNSGKSIAGGNFDDTNNVEVVLVDNAGVGTWTVRVTDDYHGGSRAWQSYAIAVRGVNVNDLKPEPTFSPDVSLNPPIPQIGDNVQIGVTVENIGAGSVPELEVMARADGSLISTQIISLTPGESVQVEWNWTPTTDGLVDLSFHIDPNNLVEESNELNNVLTQTIIISAPGVRLTTDESFKTLQEADDSSTSWQILMTNTGLNETNATISATAPVRISDGAQFDWFYSFTSNTFNLLQAESVEIGFTLIHPAPPQPGTYAMTLTGTDVENDIQSELNVYFEVPVLSAADVQITTGQISVSPISQTQIQVYVSNEGNGPQTYDVELSSPAGWHLGLDSLGAFEGSSHGSTGTLAVGQSRVVDITVNPPGAMIPAGSVFDAGLTIHSRVSTESWSVPIPLEIMAIDRVTTTPISDGTEYEVSPYETLELEIQFLNNGNRDLTMTPYQRGIPSGWSIAGGMQTLNAPAGESTTWSVTLQGNGLATSGDFKLRFATEDGFSIDWNRTIDVLSAAVPSLAFNQVVLADGTSSNTPLGVGAHPVGTSFDLAWKVENEGTSTWRPSTSIIVPNDEWTANCPTSPSTLDPGTSSIIWCTVLIPLSEQAGSEPTVSLRMEGEGVVVENSITLLVDSVSAVVWNLRDNPIVNQAVTEVSMTVDIQNIGNSEINHVLTINAPDGWNAFINDELIVRLSPGESRSIVFEFTPKTAKDGSIVLTLKNAETIQDSTFTFEVEVIPTSGEDEDIISTLIPILGMLLLVVILGGGFFVFRQRGGDLQSMVSSQRISSITESLNQRETQSGSGIECWVCSDDIFVGDALACNSCGARYHRPGQVGGCDVLSVGRCLNCDADWSELVDA